MKKKSILLLTIIATLLLIASCTDSILNTSDYSFNASSENVTSAYDSHTQLLSIIMVEIKSQKMKSLSIINDQWVENQREIINSTNKKSENKALSIQCFDTLKQVMFTTTDLAPDERYQMSSPLLMLDKAYAFINISNDISYRDDVRRVFLDYRKAVEDAMKSNENLRNKLNLVPTNLKTNFGISPFRTKKGCQFAELMYGTALSSVEYFHSEFPDKMHLSSNQTRGALNDFFGGTAMDAIGAAVGGEIGAIGGPIAPLTGWITSTAFSGVAAYYCHCRDSAGDYD